jgi:hypothetical protein
MARNGFALPLEKQSHRLPANVSYCGVFLVKNKQ